MDRGSREFLDGLILKRLAMGESASEIAAAMVYRLKLAGINTSHYAMREKIRRLKRREKIKHAVKKRLLKEKYFDQH